MKNGRAKIRINRHKQKISEMRSKSNILRFDEFPENHNDTLQIIIRKKVKPKEENEFSESNSRVNKKSKLASFFYDRHSVNANENISNSNLFYMYFS